MVLKPSNLERIRCFYITFASYRSSGENNNKRMKIALTGAHGVGKSTLANFLMEQIKKKSIYACVTPEVPRLICDEMKNKEYFRRSNNSLLKQSLILFGQLVLEEESIENTAVKICDRTIIDHWAYSLNLFSNDIHKEELSKMYEFFISKHCLTYDKIFYIPNEIKPIDDGVRESDINFQEEIDRAIVSLMDKFKLNYETVTGSVENRCQIIIKSLAL